MSFSLIGLPSKVLKAGPQFNGVVINEFSPAAWIALNKIPVEIETLNSL